MAICDNTEADYALANLYDSTPSDSAKETWGEDQRTGQEGPEHDAIGPEHNNVAFLPYQWSRVIIHKGINLFIIILGQALRVIGRHGKHSGHSMPAYLEHFLSSKGKSTAPTPTLFGSWSI